MSYYGLCIGGPYDGQEMNAHAPAIEISELLPLTAPLDAKSVELNNAAVNVRYYRYVHEAIGFKGKESLFFWRLDEQSSRDAMARLFASYTCAPCNDHYMGFPIHTMSRGQLMDAVKKLAEMLEQAYRPAGLP